MTEYVVGFLFRNNNTEVALIRKTKPEWQRGRLNGVGGKVEAGESPVYAMSREFEEETGACVLGWERFLTLTYPKATIHFFKLSTRFLVQLTTTTDEVVGWWTVDDLQNEATIPNLCWLIPLALDKTNVSGELSGGV